MFTGASRYQGSWSPRIEENQVVPSFLEANKNKMIVITVVAAVAISALVAGGLLLYFKVNTIAALSLMGGGGALTMGNLIGGVVIYVRHQRPSSDAEMNQRVAEKNPSEERGQKVKGTHKIKVVSWNVGTRGDYGNMCHLKQRVKFFMGKNEREGAFVDIGNNIFEDVGFFIAEEATTEKKALTKEEALWEAWQEVSTSGGYDTTQEEENARMGIFQHAFEQFDNPDIICLQESHQIEKEKDWERILPGYTVFTYARYHECNCTIAWKSAQFSKVDQAKIMYDPDYIPSSSSAPDTIVLLKDNANGTTICVGSAHLCGFSLAYETLEGEEKEANLQQARAGDNQTSYDLDTMEGVRADLYIFAGDFNVTREHYQPRLGIIEEYGYRTDLRDNAPTIIDPNLTDAEGSIQAARLDYVYTKGGDRVQFGIKGMDLTRTALDEFENRPSDHLPVGAEIEFTFL